MQSRKWTGIPATPELRRRINAARELAEPTEEELRERSVHRERGVGYGLSVEELGARINRDGFGHKVIGQIRRGERGIRDYELGWIADACDLPLEFFTVDLQRLTEIPESAPGVDALLDQLGTLDQAMGAIREQITRLAERGAPGVPGATGRALRAVPPKQEDRRKSETAQEED